jgi:hypothetical protein
MAAQVCFIEIDLIIRFLAVLILPSAVESVGNNAGEVA